MCAVYFLSYFQRIAVPGAVFDQVQGEMHASASAVTALGAIFLYIYAAMQLVVGLAADRFGGRRVLLLGGTIMCAGAICFPLSHSLPMLYASRALTGLGASCMYLSIVKEIDALWGPRQFPAVLGVVLFLGYSGGMAAGTPFHEVVDLVGWRNGLLGVGLVNAATVVVAWVVLRRIGGQTQAPKSLSLRPMLEILRNRRSRPLLLAALINFPIYLLVQATIGKKFLEDCGNLSPDLSSACITGMVAISVISVFLAGPLLWVTGHRRRPFVLAAPVLVLAAMVILSVGAITHAPAWVLAAGCAVLAISTGQAPPTAAITKELNDPQYVSQAIAVSNCLAYVGGALLASVAGGVLDAFAGSAVRIGERVVYDGSAYAALFGSMALLAAVSLVISRRIPETGGDHLVRV